MNSYNLRTCWPSFEGQDQLVLEAASECLSQPSIGSRSRQSESIAEASRCEPRHRIAITNSGRSALRIALAMICGDGSPIAVEEWTDPAGLRAVLDLGAAPIAIGIDRQGMIPQELAAAAEAGVRRVLIQSRIHTPTGASIGAGRRRAIADIVATHDMLVVENDGYGFLQPPDMSGLSHLVPEACIRTVSFGKWISPDIGGGLIEFPSRYTGLVGERMERSGACAPGFGIAALAQLAKRGHFSTFAEAKRSEGIARQCMARRLLRVSQWEARSPSWHFWLPLEDVPAMRIGASRTKGVEVSGGFRLPGRHRPHVCISLGGERDRARLEAGLAELAGSFGNDNVRSLVSAPLDVPQSSTDQMLAY